MAKEKKSFFERLTGTVRLDEKAIEREEKSKGDLLDSSDTWAEEEKDAELTVDVSQNANEIIIKTMVAGVHPEDLDVDITRDMITIKGHREEERAQKDEDHFIQELYWGSFSRSISLPEEIDVDAAEATEKHGLLVLRLPKIDKGRKTKLKIKTI